MSDSKSLRHSFLDSSSGARYMRHTVNDPLPLLGGVCWLMLLLAVISGWDRSIALSSAWAITACASVALVLVRLRRTEESDK